MFADDHVAVRVRIAVNIAIVLSIYIGRVARLEQDGIELEFRKWLADPDRHLVAPVPDIAVLIEAKRVPATS